MRPGTRVRLLHGKEEGVVRNVKDGNLVEVEIEEGFIIPVMKRELVVISDEESVSFSAKDEEQSYIQELPKGHDEGIYLAYIPFNDRVYHQYIINDTVHEILFTLHEQEGKTFKGSYSGLISRRSSIKTGERDISRFDEWPVMIVQALFYNVAPGMVREPMVKKLQPAASSFYKNKKQVPVLNKNGHVFRIDESIKEINPSQLKEAISENKKPQPAATAEHPPSEVDLHIDKLLKNPGVTVGANILDIQLREFEKYLENAIASDMKQITFIHGIGNGTLKNKIHNHLKKHKQVKSFSEAKPEKFGYGATLVIFN